MTGVLASLAAAGVSIFAISSYDAGYVLVSARDVTTASAPLVAAAHDVDAR